MTFDHSVFDIRCEWGEHGVRQLAPLTVVAGDCCGHTVGVPSPNGARLTLATGGTPTFAGCVRNGRAVAAAALRYGNNIAVIPAGERWPEDGSRRVAVEDVVGAGAIISHLSGSLSPEAHMAVLAYHHARENLVEVFGQCGSGKALRERGVEGDMALAAQVDVDDCAPMLQNGAYIKAEQGTAPDRDAAALHPRRGVLAFGGVTSRGRHRR
jgi:2-phosphosulfolactate phosphatase